MARHSPGPTVLEKIGDSLGNSPEIKRPADGCTILHDACASQLSSRRDVHDHSLHSQRMSLEQEERTE